jgi:protein phosphatase 1 regulatory subunit 7
LKGLQDTESLRFLKVQLNTIGKVGQLAYIENLPLLTDLDLSCNPIQNRKFYRSQVLFHIPQLRDLDGVKILAEEKIKAENLHGLDQNDKELIF